MRYTPRPRLRREEIMDHRRRQIHEWFVILALVYYGVILPLRGIAVMSGTVRVKTRLDPEAGSYWEEPGAEAEPDLERQF